ncbi:hypothetical protein CPB83DRAFT_852147 [Crepidotus variabilis]|uniref:Uncharacterized protein n=1 Tax=Crepidotus variabilis TaxID=179855 RepID=A0A9P6EJ30_9AGAR|nr:hypothetical protein CPB83DRAFT_852147 [Crepidotus variabilis]
MELDGRTVHRESDSFFDEESADTLYTSSDGVKFKLRSEHIRVNAPRLPIPSRLDEKPTGMEVSLALEESSEVLDDLFQFVQPPSETRRRRERPALYNEKYQGPALFQLVEAAEKYAVFGAIDVCLFRLEQLVQQRKHLLEIINLSDKYGYTSILDTAAELALNLPLDTNMLETFETPGLLQRFILYRSQWTSTRDKALEVFANSVCHVAPITSDGFDNVCPTYRKRKLIYMSLVAEDIKNAAKSPESMHLVCQTPGRGCNSDFRNLVAVVNAHNELVRRLSEFVL